MIGFALCCPQCHELQFVDIFPVIKVLILFDVHRTVHRNVFFYSKPKQMQQCIKLFYIEMSLYMFRTVFPSIISSSNLELLMMDGKTVRNMQSDISKVK